MRGAAELVPAFEKPRLDPAYIEAWLEKHHVDLRKLERGEPVWPTAEGLVPLTISLIEDSIARRDVVAWSYLNLTERRDLKDEDTGQVIVPAGSEWSFFEIQAALARLKGDILVQCASGIGKTRDIQAGTLHEMDTATGNVLSVIAADEDKRLDTIWNDIEFQLDTNPGIGGGVKETNIKPVRRKLFNNGNEFVMLIGPHDGSSFRGYHPTGTIRGDEVTKWILMQIFEELWRAAEPGVPFRLYSTPDHNYSSPFFLLCSRAIPIDLKSPAATAAQLSRRSSADVPKFLLVNITRMDIKETWTPRRAERLREIFHGEQSAGYIQNVLGQWGTPSFSVFPMETLRSVLKGAVHLPHYRMVAATIDRKQRQVLFNAARLAPGPDTVDGGSQEEILAREVVPFLDGKQLGEKIADFFPSVRDRLEFPKLYCGADLGSSQDPSEFIFVSVAGQKWTDVFRLHLRNVDYPDQEEIVTYLDHASGHRVRYGFDVGSAGIALWQALARKDEECPVKGCSERIVFAERLLAFNFGEHSNEIDIYNGTPVPNPDRTDRNGEPLPHRRGNKELSTRILEQKLQAKELAIAWDGGAGNPQLSSAQLLVNHTWVRMSQGGDRVFRGEDDHHVDARRQAALAIISELRGEPFIGASPSVVATADRRIVHDGIFGDVGSAVAAFGERSERFSMGPGWN